MYISEFAPHSITYLPTWHFRRSRDEFLDLAFDNLIVVIFFIVKLADVDMIGMNRERLSSHSRISSIFFWDDELIISVSSIYYLQYR